MVRIMQGSRGGSASWSRVLRVRALLEEQVRQGVETAAEELQALEREAQAASEAAQASRRRSFAGLIALRLTSDGETGATLTTRKTGSFETSANEIGTKSGSAAGWEEALEERLEEDSCWQRANWRRKQAEKSRPRLEQVLEKVQAELLTKRRERLEIKTLIDAKDRLRQTRAERQQQGELDSWFLSRRNGREGRGQPGSDGNKKVEPKAPGERKPGGVQKNLPWSDPESGNLKSSEKRTKPS